MFRKIFFVAIIFFLLEIYNAEPQDFFFSTIPQFKNAVWDTSSEVSKLVSRAFTNTHNPLKNNTGVVSALLKLMGLEGQKIGAIAVNSIVMVSQLIINHFVFNDKSENPKMKENGNIMSTIIESVLSKQDEHSELFARATKEDLINKISDEDDTKNFTCTKLLLCKIQPFVTEMQKNVISMVRQEKKLIDKAFFNFPPIHSLLEKFNNCDAAFPQCSYQK